MVDLNKVKPSDLWYVIGYITADGNLSIDSRHINITSKDRSHLYSIKRALLLRNSVGRKARGHEKEKKYSQLQFGDVNFYGYLKGIGLTSKKSLTLGSLNINDKFFIDFLRGVIDGDGNISTWVHKSNRNSQWYLRIFSASTIFINWLNNKIEQELNVKGKLYSRNQKDRVNIHYILKFGVKDARKILERIYYKGCLSLERRFIQTRLCLQQVDKSVKLYT